MLGNRKVGDCCRWRCAEPEWELFQDNKTIWQAVHDECDVAKHTIELEQYIFGAEGIGRRLLDLLAMKARQGVAIRVLVDGLGSYGLASSEGGRRLLRSGGRIATYNGAADLLRHPIARAHRLHRKTLIRDGSSVFVGGSCYQDRMSNWRDTMIRVSGPLPSAVTSEFQRAWQNAHHQSVAFTPGSRICMEAEAGWFYALSGPLHRGKADLRETIAEKISQAKSAVTLTTPYLAPDRSLWRAMVTAVERGARVRVLMPARSDHRVLDMVGHRFAHALQNRGVEVHCYTRGMHHAKIALVDGAWSSVSSFNLDLFSAKLNLESGILSTSRALNQALAAQMDADLACSRRI